MQLHRADTMELHRLAQNTQRNHVPGHHLSASTITGLRVGMWVREPRTAATWEKKQQLEVRSPHVCFLGVEF